MFHKSFPLSPVDKLFYHVCIKKDITGMLNLANKFGFTATYRLILMLFGIIIKSDINRAGG
jgi:hypothetical protein